MYAKDSPIPRDLNIIYYFLHSKIKINKRITDVKEKVKFLLMTISLEVVLVCLRFKYKKRKKEND